MEQYDLFADIYDVDMGNKTTDLEFYIKHSQGKDNVLILAAGTGREIIPIAQAGTKVAALDISSKMLEKAKEKVAKESLGDLVSLYQADMRNFSLNQEFDAVYAANNTILHLLTIPDLEKCMQRVYAHLKNGGIFIVDYFQPEFSLLGQSKSELIHDYTQYREDLKKYVTRSRIHYRDMFKQLNRTQVIYEFIDENGAVTKRVCEYTIRYIFQYEMQLLLEKNGFKIISTYGNYDLSPLTASSRYFIFVAQKAE